MQIYLRTGFSSPTQASFFLIFVSDSTGAGYHQRMMPKPAEEKEGRHSEVKPVKNISKNLQSFLEISPVQQEVLLRPCIWLLSSLTEKLPESIEPSRFVSHRARMSGELDSRKDLQLTKFEWRPQIFFCRHLLKISASMYESSGLQFFRTTTGIQSGRDVSDKSRFIITFLTIFWVKDTLCSFRLVLEGKTRKDRLQHMRHANAHTCLCTCLKH